MGAQGDSWTLLANNASSEYKPSAFDILRNTIFYVSSSNIHHLPAEPHGATDLSK